MPRRRAPPSRVLEGDQSDSEDDGAPTVQKRARKQVAKAPKKPPAPAVPKNPTPTPSPQPTRGTKRDTPPDDDFHESPSPFADRKASSSPAPDIPSSPLAAKSEEEPSVEGLWTDIQGTRGKAVAEAVISWIEEYESDQLEASIKLIFLIINASGSAATPSLIKSTTAGKSNEDDFQDRFDTLDIPSFIAEATNFIPMTVGDQYPVVSKDKKMKMARKSLMDFFDKLIRRCAAGHLFDEYLLDTLLAWLAAITSSEVRAFRHTSTLVGLQIITSLVNVASSLKQKFTIADRQFQASQGDKLRKEREDLHAQIQRTESSIKSAFDSIFVHRFCDVDPRIRSACLEGLAHWIVGLPTAFYVDAYTKYIGWMLSDKAEPVRLAAIKALHEVYTLENTTSRMDLFFRKFRARLVQMIRDKSITVAESVLDLLTKCLEPHLDAFEESDFDEIRKNLFNESSALRRAAGRFVFQHEFQDLHQDDSDEDEIAFKLRALLTFVEISSDESVEDPALFIVDALWASMEVLRDWSGVCGLILSSAPGARGQALADNQTALLLRVFRHAVFKGAGLPLLKDDKLTTAPDESMNVEILHNLPKLLNTFKTDPNIIANLSEIVPLMDYSTQDAKQTNAVLSCLMECAQRHSAIDTLQSLAAALRHLTQEDSVVLSDAMEAVAILRSHVAERVHAWAQGKIQIDADEINECQPVVAHSRRLYYALQAGQPQLGTTADIDADLDTLLSLALTTSDAVPPQAIGYLLKSRLSLVCTDFGLGAQGGSSESIAMLLRQRDSVIEQANQFQDARYGQDVNSDALLTLTTLYLMFSPRTRDATFSKYPDEFTENTLIDNLEHRLSQASDDDDDGWDELSNLMKCVFQLLLWKAFKPVGVSRLLSHYVQHGRRVEEAIKAWFAKIRELHSSHEEATYILGAMKLLHTRMLVSDDPQQASNNLTALSKRIATSFGVGVQRPGGRSHSTLREVLRMGGEYCIAADDQLSFADALFAFASKFDSGESSVLAQRLEDEFTAQRPEDAEYKKEWAPFSNLLLALRRDAGAHPPMTVPRPKRETKKARGTPRSVKLSRYKKAVQREYSPEPIDDFLSEEESPKPKPKPKVKRMKKFSWRKKGRLVEKLPQLASPR